MQNAIVLSRQDGTWHATFRGDHAAEIRELFGTATLPTPYRATFPVAGVVAELKLKNPDCIITVEA